MNAMSKTNEAGNTKSLTKEQLRKAVGKVFTINPNKLNKMSREKLLPYLKGFSKQKIEHLLK